MIPPPSIHAYYVFFRNANLLNWHRNDIRPTDNCVRDFCIIIISHCFHSHYTHFLKENVALNTTHPSLRRPRSQRHPIRNTPIRHSRILPITRKLIRRILQALALNLNERLQLTPAVRALATRREAGSERERALVDDEMHV